MGVRVAWARSMVGTAVVAVLCAGGAVAAQADDDRVLILAQPFARADAVWMAQARGFFKAERLRVTVRWVSAARDALRVFQQTKDDAAAPAGFVVVNDALAVDFWQSTGGEFVVIAPLARDADAYVAVARKDVASPEALRTKTIAVQLGSTSAWFLHEYLRAQGLSERDVALRDAAPAAILDWDPAAGDVAVYFVREPYASRALEKFGNNVRRLATARGYAHGYLLLGTWKRTLRDRAGLAERLLRALDRGREHAVEHREDVIAFARGMFGTDTTAVEADYASAERLIGFDSATHDDFRRLGRWMREAGLLAASAEPAALFELAPLSAIFPERVSPAPGEPPR